MKKKEALALEALCEKWLKQKLETDVQVSMSLNGRFKVNFDNGFMNFEEDFNTVHYFNYYGWYKDFVELRDKMVECFSEHADDFRQLLWSYENRNLLED